MNSGEEEKYYRTDRKIGWPIFEVCNKDNPYMNFENMCRNLFDIEFFGGVGKGPFTSRPNNPGTEILPVECKGKKISFQAKYIKENASSDIYKELARSVDQTIKHYDGQLDELYFYSNRELDTTSSRYLGSEEKLLKSKIILRLITHNDILNRVKDNGDVLKEFFGPDGFEEILQRLAVINEKIDHIVSDDRANYKKNSLYKTDEYLKMWKAPLGREEEVSLEKFYEGREFLLPNLYGDLKNDSPDYEDSVEQCDANIVNKENIEWLLHFLTRKKGFIVAGAPGSGKSTLLAWICKKLGDKALTYSMKDVFYSRKGRKSNYDLWDWNFFLERTELSGEDLNEKCILLDDLEEIYTGFNDNAEFKKYINDIIDRIHDSGAISIISCRENYILQSENEEALTINIPYIRLKPWKYFTINKFIEYYLSEQEKQFLSGDIQKKLESVESVYGNPLILHMTLKWIIKHGIEDEKSLNEMDIFDMFFAGKNINLKKYSVDSHGKIQESKIENTFKQYKKIAFHIFENGENGIEEKELPKDIYRDCLMRNANGVWEFLNRPMYQYFVVKFFSEKIESILDNGQENISFDESSIKALAEELSFLGKKGKFVNSKNIYENVPWIELLYFKLNNVFEKKNFLVSYEKRKQLFLWWEKGTRLLFRKGMILQAGAQGNGDEDYSLISMELNCCKNLLELLNIVYQICKPEQKENNIMENVWPKIFTYDNKSYPISEDKAKISRYLRLVSIDGYKLPLHNMDLNNMDLSYAHLSEEEFNHIELKNVKLNHANMRGCKLRCSDLTGAQLQYSCLSSINSDSKERLTDLHSAIIKNANFKFADLSGVDLTDVGYSTLDKYEGIEKIDYATFEGARLNYAKIDAQLLSKACFVKADLRNIEMIDLPSAELNGVNLKGACLEKVKFNDARMENADLEEAFLKDADFSDAILSEAKFKDADLENANFNSTCCDHARFDHANLKNAMLSNADLMDANFSYAELTNANLDSACCDQTRFDYANLENAILTNANLTNADFTEAILECAKMTSSYLIEEEDGERIEKSTFPIKSLEDAKFETIFVDDIAYSRDEFFDEFQ